MLLASSSQSSAAAAALVFFGLCLAVVSGLSSTPAAASRRPSHPPAAATQERLAQLKLFVGNKAYSSWSLRAWLALREAAQAPPASWGDAAATAEKEGGRAAQVPVGARGGFVEVVLELAGAGSDVKRAELEVYSPSGKVPALVDPRAGGLTVWDSLAIIEYVAELAPEARLWPQDQGLRAVARSACAEMDSGFEHLRTVMPMNTRKVLAPGDGKRAAVLLDERLLADIERVKSLWAECRQATSMAATGGQGAEKGTDGPYLFGHFTAADAMFAPVVLRFRTYRLSEAGECGLLGPEDVA